MDWETFSFATLVVGELLVATTALMVHENVQEYRRLPKARRKVLERERVFGWLGAACIFLGGLAHVLLKFFQ